MIPVEIMRKILFGYGGRFGAILYLLWSLSGLPDVLLNRKWDQLKGEIGGVSVAMVLLSLTWRGKRTTDMLAEIGAKVSIQNATTPNSSADPAIQRAIENEIANGNEKPPPSRSGPA